VCASGQGCQHIWMDAGTGLETLPLSSGENLKFGGSCGPLPFAGCNVKGCCERTRVARRGSGCKMGLGESAAPLLLSAPIVAHTGQKPLSFESHLISFLLK